VHRHHLSRNLGVLAVTAAALGLVPAGAVAGCVGPVLAVGPVVDPADAEDLPASQAALPLGEAVTVSGRWFHEGCDDTGQGSGCTAPVPSEESPLRDVDLVLEQGGSSWELGTADAASREEQYAVTWQVRVPDGAQPGSATLRAGTASLPVELEP
jgi:hypothetical protein